MVSRDLLKQSNEVKLTESGRQFQRLINLSLKKDECVELLNLCTVGWPLVWDVASSKKLPQLTRTKPNMIFICPIAIA